MKMATPLLCIALSLPASGQIPEGVRFFQTGHYAEARRILTPRRNDPEAVKTLALIAQAEGDADHAIELFEKAIAMRPASSAYHVLLGEAFLAKGENASAFAMPGLARRATTEFEKAVSLDPDDVDARFGLIYFYAMAPSFLGGSEVKAMQQAAEIRKRDVYMGHRAYARIYTIQKKNDLVRKEWEDFVREQPKSPIAHSAYGSFLAITEKNIKGGLDEIELAIQLNPGYMPAWYRLGNVAAVSGSVLARGEEALKKYLAYQPAKNEPSLASAYYYLGMIHEKQGKRAEARRSYAEAARFTPSSKTYAEALKRVS